MQLNLTIKQLQKFIISSKVGLDEGTLGVLVQKLKELDRASFLKQVAGFTWWSRLLQYTNFHHHK